jgi:YhcH/YjgK/YiaL family protein
MNKDNLTNRINYAIDYVKKQNLNDLPIGKYGVDEQSYFTVQEYTTRKEEKSKFESHKNYVDVHLMINGMEKIKVTSCDNLTLDTAYDEDSDAALWVASDNTSNVMEMVLGSGSYVVLYPEHVHMPGLVVNEEIKVRKVVVKIEL